MDPGTNGWSAGMSSRLPTGKRRAGGACSAVKYSRNPNIVTALRGLSKSVPSRSSGNNGLLETR